MPKANFQPMRQKPKLPDQTLAKKRKQRQSLRVFLRMNSDKFPVPKTSIKRVIDSLENWEKGGQDQ